jgi:hypothetical protein
LACALFAFFLACALFFFAGTASPCPPPWLVSLAQAKHGTVSDCGGKAVACRRRDATLLTDRPQATSGSAASARAGYGRAW